jgi:hypothetical protein
MIRVRAGVVQWQNVSFESSHLDNFTVSAENQNKTNKISNINQVAFATTCGPVCLIYAILDPMDSKFG